MINVLGYMRWFREPDLRTFPWLAERSELFRELGLAGRARAERLRVRHWCLLRHSAVCQPPGPRVPAVG